MSHLGNRVTALLDGELSPDVAARAHAHLEACAACREALETQRQVRMALASSPDPGVPAALMDALLGMGGPAGPLPPRPGHLPGSPRPDAVSLPPRAATRRPPVGSRGPVAPTTGAPASGPGRRSSRRLTVAVIGSVSVASAGVLSVFVLTGVLLAESLPSVPATSQLTIEGDRARSVPAPATAPTAATGASPTSTAPAQVAVTLPAPRVAPSGPPSSTPPTGTAAVGPQPTRQLVGATGR